MEYILSQGEYDALTPVKRLQNRNEALETARKIILELSKFPCGKRYCVDCPIYVEGSGEARHGRKLTRDYICLRQKDLPK